MTKMKVYVCYDIACDAYNQCYDAVRKVVKSESQAISWVQDGGHSDEGPTRSYDEFEVEE